MAGAQFKVEVDDRAVREALDRLVDRSDDLTPALSAIGEHLLISHHERFAREEAPDGTPWAPLSPSYAARKAKRSAGGLLVLDDLLRGGLRWQVSGNELQLGTDRVYGATHQFGREEANIPARPFLGLDADDEAAVIEILTHHLQEGLRR